MRSIELTELLDDILSRILIPYIYTIRVLLARKIFHEENFLQAKFFLVTLMYRFRYYSIDYIAVIPTDVIEPTEGYNVPLAQYTISDGQIVVGTVLRCGVGQRIRCSELLNASSFDRQQSQQEFYLIVP